jgi:hypothetical protein
VITESRISRIASIGNVRETEKEKFNLIVTGIGNIFVGLFAEDKKTIDSEAKNSKSFVDRVWKTDLPQGAAPRRF